MSDQGPNRDRQEQIMAAVLKVVGIALAIGLVIGIGTWILVKSLGLNDANNAGAIQVDPVAPSSLPTTALPSPTQPTDSPTGTPTGTPTDGITGPDGVPTQSLSPSPGNGALFLNASPLFVKPMERINLTGQWPGHDAVSLLVQRKEHGAWEDFGVQTQVDIGTFATYVLTGHTGDNQFRVYDPDSDTASNSVVVTVQN